LLWRLFEVNNGIKHTYQVVIPEVLKAEVLHDIDEGILGGHLGVDKKVKGKILLARTL